MADLSITASNVSVVSGAINQGIAGVAIAAGKVGFKGADGTMVLSDADDTDLDTVEVIFLNSAAAGQPVAYAEPGAILNLGATLVAGTAYYLSGTAGGICPVADQASGDKSIIIGMAKSTSQLIFKPFDSGVIL